MIDEKTKQIDEREIKIPCPFCKKIILFRDSPHYYISNEYGTDSPLWCPLEESEEFYLNDRQQDQNSVDRSR